MVQSALLYHHKVTLKNVKRANFVQTYSNRKRNDLVINRLFYTILIQKNIGIFVAKL
nr:MAG TPA: hypothetical protein [Caudoviricetes sp.]